jgi:uncharacterized iron-regulated membrane protein
MKQFRKIIFWLHLCAGVFAGIVVLIMSVTGVALTYEKQMLTWADLRNYRVPPPQPDAPRLPMALVLERLRAEKGELPSTVTVRPDVGDPVALAYGRETTLYANPYNGEILGEGSAGLRSFFRFMTDWHRWLGAGADNRSIGKAITGACNLAFLFIVVSGFYLWWPRNWRWPSVKSVIFFRGGVRGKARDFNWHNVIGFWSAVPLFFVVLSATVISYPWASNLAYRVVGEEPPARRAPGLGPGGPGGSARARDGRPEARNSARPLGQTAGGESGQAGLRAEAARETEIPHAASTATEAGAAAAGGQPASSAPQAGGQRPRREGRQRNRPGREGRPGSGPGGPGFGAPPADLQLDDLDALFARARQQVPGWRTISLRLPRSNDEPLSFQIDQGSGGQPHLRSTLTLDRQTAQVVRWETFSDGSPGRRLRSWLRFIHTGEAGGLAGQTIAGLVSAGAVFLVYTGLALSVRRFFAWAARRRWRAREEAFVED